MGAACAAESFHPSPFFLSTIHLTVVVNGENKGFSCLVLQTPPAARRSLKKKTRIYSFYCFLSCSTYFGLNVFCFLTFREEKADDEMQGGN